MSKSLMHRWYPALLLIFFVAISVGMLRMLTPMKSVGDDAPLSVFSSVRAFSDLTSLLKENIPHPPGSEANKIIRDRIYNKMKAHGYTVEIQSVFNCVEEDLVCSSAENVVAYKKGSKSHSSIMLMAHYDSVPASIAASDDGMGVAALMEVANVVKNDDVYDNDLIFLFTDAEELGLNGAEGFAENHPLMKDVDIIINVESRGTSGQSIMFETGHRNRELLNAYRSAVERPVANSLTYAIYKKMPNDTDYSVFRKRDVAGLNFASVGSALRYHSVKDDLEHVDLDTLQQHGSNVLNLVRFYSNMDLVDIDGRTGEATYFDLFSAVMVVWDSSLNLPLSILFVLLVIGLICLNRRQRVGHMQAGLRSVGNLFAVSFVMLGITALISFPLGVWVDQYPLDHINPWPGKIAIWASIFLSVCMVSKLTRNTVDFNDQVLISWLLIGLVSLALAYFLSGASYIVLAPLAVFVVATIIDCWRSGFSFKDNDLLVSSHLGFIVTIYMAVYHFHILDMVFGFERAAFKSLPFLFMSIALLPLLQRYYRREDAFYRSHQLLLAGITVIATAVSMSISGFTKDKPAPLNVVYVENWDKKEAFWMLESYYKASPKFSDIMGFSPADEDAVLYGGLKIEKPVRRADYKSLPAPEVDVTFNQEVGNERIIKMDLKSAREGYQMYLFIDTSMPIKHFTVNGETPLGDDKLLDGKAQFRLILGASQNKVFHVEVVLNSHQPFTMDLVELADLKRTPDNQRIISRKPENANEVHNGDRSIVYRKVVI